MLIALQNNQFQTANLKELLETITPPTSAYLSLVTCVM